MNKARSSKKSGRANCVNTSREPNTLGIVGAVLISWIFVLFYELDLLVCCFQVNLYSVTFE